MSALSLSSTNFTLQACRDMAAVFPTRIRWMWIRILLCSATWIRILFHILMWIRSQLYISILKNPKQNLSYPKDGSRKCCGFRSRGKKNVDPGMRIADPDPGAPWMRIRIQGPIECGSRSKILRFGYPHDIMYLVIFLFVYIKKHLTTITSFLYHISWIHALKVGVIRVYKVKY